MDIPYPRPQSAMATDQQDLLSPRTQFQRLSGDRSDAPASSDQVTGLLDSGSAVIAESFCCLTSSGLE